MVLVDTSVWIDYFRGIESRHTRMLDQCLDENRVATGDLIIIELLQGFKSKWQIEAAHQIISRLEYYDLVGRDIAYRATENYRVLRDKGITVRKTIDTIIGTFCIVNQMKLLHNDRDFDPMTKYLGLKVA
jgi:predicted nucleic acid-binding protein